MWSPFSPLIVVGNLSHPIARRYTAVGGVDIVSGHACVNLAQKLQLPAELVAHLDRQVEATLAQSRAA